MNKLSVVILLLIFISACIGSKKTHKRQKPKEKIVIRDLTFIYVEGNLDEVTFYCTDNSSGLRTYDHEASQDSLYMLGGFYFSEVIDKSNFYNSNGKFDLFLLNSKISWLNKKKQSWECDIRLPKDDEIRHLFIEGKLKKDLYLTEENANESFLEDFKLVLVKTYLPKPSGAYF